MIPSAWDFRNRLAIILNTARQNGQAHVDVESDKLHKQVTGQSESNHRMAVCCEVMMRMMRAGDLVLTEPANEAGARMMIRYIVSNHLPG